MKRRVALICLALAGCADLPRDPEGTSERVAAARRIVAGFATPVMPPARRLIAEVARETGAVPVVRHGSLEPLIVDLDAGRVDLVVAEVSRRTPWKTLVAPGPPLATRGEGKERIELRALMKNGENRWIMLVERASRRIAPGPGG